jgi:hypothetical protein
MLQFAIFDVFVLLSLGNIDDEELDAFNKSLEDPDYSNNPVVRELFQSVSGDWENLWASYYSSENIVDPKRMAASFKRVGKLLDSRLSADDAEKVKIALTTVAVPNARLDRPDPPPEDDPQAEASLAIAVWLGLGAPR